MTYNIIFADDNETDSEIEENEDVDPEYIADVEEKSSSKDPYPGIEIKRKIIEVWRKNGLKRVKQRYRRITNERTLRNWKKSLEEGKYIKILSLAKNPSTF